MARGTRAIALYFALVSCQLADPKDAPKCEEGFHPELQHCEANTTTEIQVKIEAAPGGTSCSGDLSVQRAPKIDPESLTVKVGEQFQFYNLDVVPHEIRGTDGLAWISAKPGERSAFFSIVKAGTWGYRVSGCQKGGSVTVQ
jgi:plastocyanin